MQDETWSTHGKVNLFVQPAVVRHAGLIEKADRLVSLQPIGTAIGRQLCWCLHNSDCDQKPDSPPTVQEECGGSEFLE